MMLLRCTFIIIVLLAGQVSFSQDKKDQTILILDESPSKQSERSTLDTKVQIEAVENEKFIQAGILADRELSDPNVLTDKDLQNSEFIIHRSPDIKIIYTPSPVKNN